MVVAILSSTRVSTSVGSSTSSINRSCSASNKPEVDVGNEVVSSISGLALFVFRLRRRKLFLNFTKIVIFAWRSLGAGETTTSGAEVTVSSSNSISGCCCCCSFETSIWREPSVTCRAARRLIGRLSSASTLRMRRLSRLDFFFRSPASIIAHCSMTGRRSLHNKKTQATCMC